MIDKNPTLARRTRIIARTLAAAGGAECEISAKSIWSSRDHDTYHWPPHFGNRALLGNPEITLGDAIESLLTSIAHYCNYAGNEDFNSSYLEVTVFADGAYTIYEHYTEIASGMTYKESVDLDEYDEEAA